MSDQEPLAGLLAALRDLLGWLDAEGVPSLIVGGVAAAVLGRPRLTGDIAALVLVDEARWPDFFATGAKFGFAAHRPHDLADIEAALVTHPQSL